jgi:dephospho-CoA kinase
MLVIGLTGGIGTGKSEVSRIFAESGARVLNADKIANQITDTNLQVIQQIKAHFGEHIYTSEGCLDRKQLGHLVFEAPQALRTLNQIVHPHLHAALKTEIQFHRELNSDQPLVIEVALLYEIGLEHEFDLVIVVSSIPSSIIERITKRDGIPWQEVMHRISTQLPQSEKEQRADIVIQNDSDLTHLREKVTQLYQALIQSDTKRISSQNPP